MRRVGAVVLALMATACSGSSSGSGAPRIASGGSVDPLNPPSPASTLLFLPHVHPAGTVLASKAKFGGTSSLAWTFQRLDDGGRSVVIAYQPSNQCLTGNEAVFTQETISVVTITVVQRVVTEGTCPIGGPYLVRVALTAPLGSRRLIHGTLAP